MNDKSRRLRVGVTCNLKKNIASELPDAEAEYDDIDTILAIQSALEEGGHAVEIFEAADDLPARLVQNRPDIVFNVAEGIAGRGREAQVPAILGFLGIPYTGSDETAMCIAMDKALAKRLLATYGINTPKYAVVGTGDRFPEEEFSYPAIVKPNAEGSSKGISDLSIAADAAELRSILAEKIGAYKQDMLAEEYIHGREFTVGLLGNGENLRVFPPMEIIFADKTHSIYSYEVKRDFRRYIQYKCPPDIDAGLRVEIERTAEKIFRVLACRDFARIDFRLSREGRLYFIEINPLPGLAPGYSDFPMLAEFCGVHYAPLVRGILDSALRRYGLFNGAK